MPFKREKRLISFSFMLDMRNMKLRTLWAADTQKGGRIEFQGEVVFARAPGKRGASKVQGGKRANRRANGQTGGVREYERGNGRHDLFKHGRLAASAENTQHQRNPDQDNSSLSRSLVLNTGSSSKIYDRLEQGVGGTDETRTILVLKEESQKSQCESLQIFETLPIHEKLGRQICCFFHELKQLEILNNLSSLSWNICHKNLNI